MDVLQSYGNQDGTVRYAANTVDVQRRQKSCKTAEIPDMPVRNEMEDVELPVRSSLMVPSSTNTEARSRGSDPVQSMRNALVRSVVSATVFDPPPNESIAVA